MRVVFMGSPEFSVPSLEAIVEAGHDVVAVYCQPPRPAGRGKKERVTPVHSRAEQLGLTVYFPENFKGAADLEDFKGHNADVAVVVAYGLLLPTEILKAPVFGCINIHASLLPRWRGAAPIHRAVMAGDAETGICIMKMDAGLDTGPVLLRRETPITDADTTGVLHDRLSNIGAELVIEALATLPDLKPEPQSNTGVTYADKIQKSETEIVWTRSSDEVSRHIRALSSFPGAWSMMHGERIKILFAQEAEGVGPPGTVLDGSLTVACGDGAVRLVELQRGGKSRMDAETFLRGFDIPKGSIFGT
ncbi:MAG: methionyl-tRNA formyltransferase [Pseudomonadota bacterium]